MAGRPPFDPFDAESEDIESYLERLQEHFTAYDIADDEDNAAKRRAILSTSIGSNCFRVLKDLAFPNALNTKTFDWEQLATLLREHFKPTRLKIAERYRFHSAVQQQGQSIADFVRELKKLAGTCEFTNEQLRYHGRWIFKKNAKNLFSLFKLRILRKIICKKNGEKSFFTFYDKERKTIFESH